MTRFSYSLKSSDFEKIKEKYLDYINANCDIINRVLKGHGDIVAQTKYYVFYKVIDTFFNYIRTDYLSYVNTFFEERFLNHAFSSITNGIYAGTEAYGTSLTYEKVISSSFDDVMKSLKSVEETVCVDEPTVEDMHFDLLVGIYKNASDELTDNYIAYINKIKSGAEYNLYELPMSSLAEAAYGYLVGLLISMTSAIEKLRERYRERIDQILSVADTMTENEARKYANDMMANELSNFIEKSMNEFTCSTAAAHFSGTTGIQSATSDSLVNVSSDLKNALNGKSSTTKLSSKLIRH